MLKNKDVLKREATDTAEAIAANVQRLENGLKNKVEYTKSVATDVIKSVKETAGKALPTHQIQRHPLPAVGAALFVGFATTFWLQRFFQPVLQSFAKEFGGEIKRASSEAVHQFFETILEKTETPFPEHTSRHSQLGGLREGIRRQL